MENSRAVLSLFLILFIAGCTFTATPTITRSSELIGNQEIISGLIRLQELSRENKTTVDMLSAFKAKVEEDHFAEDLMEEAIWLVRFGEWEHSEHSLAFLTTYVKDGTQLICPGHEIEHIQLFVKHNNFELMNHTIESVDEFYPAWKQAAYERRARFPAFYRNLDDVIKTIEGVMPKIKSGDYDILQEAAFLKANEVC